MLFTIKHPVEFMLGPVAGRPGQVGEQNHQ